jgi:hypothetical protein
MKTISLLALSGFEIRSPATVGRDHLGEVNSLYHKVDQDSEIITIYY